MDSALPVQTGSVWHIRWGLTYTSSHSSHLLQSLDGTGGDCLCGHSPHTHIIPRMLPPRGGIGSTCPRFQTTHFDLGGRTLCQHPGCAQPYISHPPDPAAATPNPGPTTSIPLVAGRGPTASEVWGKAPSAPVPVNKQRQRKAAHHTAWGTVSGSSMPRGPHRPFSGGQQSAPAPVPTEPEAAHITLAFYPLPMPESDPTQGDVDHPELYPRLPPRLFNPDRFFLAAAANQLTMDFKVPDFTKAEPSRSFYAELNADVVKTLAGRHIHLPSSGDEAAASWAIPGSATWHAMQVLGFDWTLVNLGNKRAGSTTGRILTAAEFAWHEFTIDGFNVFKSSLKNPATPGKLYYLAAPKRGPLTGTPIGMAGRHYCYPLRVTLPLSPFYDPAADPVTCYTDCVAGAPMSLPAAPVSSSVDTPPGDAHIARSHLYQRNIAYDSDEEADQLQQAINLSMADAPAASTTGPSSATPIAGPSNGRLNRPLPRPPPRRRSLSAELPHPPHIRRRLNGPATIDLTRSASPPAIRQAFTDLDDWATALTLCLGPGLSRVRAPSVELAVNGLLTHIKGFLGGETSQPGSDATSVTITPPGAFGLLAVNQSWTVSGSVGNGIVKTIMTELVNLVFSDKAIWKAIGKAKVLDALPAGVMSDSERLCRLRAYGYACMLHVVLCHSLPVHMSTVFAYALLQANGDVSVLQDMDFLRKVAPEEVLLINQWLTTPADFMAKKDDPETTALTLNYFNKMPEMFALLPPKTLDGFTQNFRHQVLFGSPDLFSQCGDVMAFADGFNGCLAASAATTLGDSFGDSLKTLIVELSAARVTSPEDVIRRIRWSSSGLARLLSVEERYKQAMLRYLRGKGIVRHQLLSLESLTEEERLIEPEDPCARVLMFLMMITGMKQLPTDEESIDLNFLDKYSSSDDAGPDPTLADPAQNPAHWPDNICPVKVHTCFNGVDVPLFGVSALLRQPLPDDNTSTDFDLYQYMMYRPVTKFSEFGGVV
ncbi:hypothetical protein C8R43DRAFT_1141600 [Mycena crocata]|nr:hypothetical protein C8R43DRAFT_1141600 [Mycena crocata]